MITACSFFISHAQPNTSFKWNFSVDSYNGKTAVLNLTASLAPGWYLYSQYIREGGPLPTQISFNSSNDFILIGKPREQGVEVKTYDDTYEMDISWYGNKVSFLQSIKLNQPLATIKGKVEFMTCSSRVCMPGEQNFILEVHP